MSEATSTKKMSVGFKTAHKSLLEAHNSLFIALVKLIEVPALPCLKLT